MKTEIPRRGEDLSIRSNGDLCVITDLVQSCHIVCKTVFKGLSPFQL